MANNYDFKVGDTIRLTNKDYVDENIFQNSVITHVFDNHYVVDDEFSGYGCTLSKKNSLELVKSMDYKFKVGDKVKYLGGEFSGKIKEIVPSFVYDNNYYIYLEDGREGLETDFQLIEDKKYNFKVGDTIRWLGSCNGGWQSSIIIKDNDNTYEINDAFLGFGTFYKDWDLELVKTVEKKFKIGNVIRWNNPSVATLGQWQNSEVVGFSDTGYMIKDTISGSGIFPYFWDLVLVDNEADETLKEKNPFIKEVVKREFKPAMVGIGSKYLQITNGSQKEKVFVFLRDGEYTKEELIRISKYFYEIAEVL